MGKRVGLSFILLFFYGFFSGFLAITSGCGKSKKAAPLAQNNEVKKPEGGEPPPPAATGKFACEGDSCSQETEYCQLSRFGGPSNPSEFVHHWACRKLPDGGKNCDYLSSHAKELHRQVSDTNNCDGTIACWNHNGQITVTCYIPRFAGQ